MFIGKAIRILIVFAVTTAIPACCDEWRMPLKFYPTSLGTLYHFTNYIGMMDGASDGYDDGIDIALPPPIDFFFPYFYISDTLLFPGMSYLREDYRATDTPGEPAADEIWRLLFLDVPGESVSVVWEVDSFPYDIEYPIFMQFIVADTIPDEEDWLDASAITEVESIYISCEYSIFFRYRDVSAIRGNVASPSRMEVIVSPNPFNSFCRISFKAPNASEVHIKIMDIYGRIANKMRFDTSGNRKNAIGEIVYDASHLPSGIYFLVVSTGSSMESKQLILIK